MSMTFFFLWILGELKDLWIRIGIMIETLAWPFMNKEILKSTIVLIFFLLKNLSVGVLINFVLIKKKCNLSIKRYREDS